jgi:hypothetical protein
MPAFIIAAFEVLGALFSRIVASRIGYWAVQLLLFFGIQIAVNKFVAGPVKSGLSAAFGGVTADVIQWIAYLNVDRAITIIISAYAAVSMGRMFLRKVTG